MANTQRQLVEDLTNDGAVKSAPVIAAFEAIDRRDFVPHEYADVAYRNYPLPIGYNQTISQPLTVAHMLELLGVEEGNRVLDLGSGSGWTTALIAHIVGRNGFVFGVERIPELAAFGRSNIAKYPWLPAKILESGEGLGLSNAAPFDRILVSAAAETLPRALVEQLNVGGTLVMPIQGALWKVVRTGVSEVQTDVIEGFAFVPLVHGEENVTLRS